MVIVRMVHVHAKAKQDSAPAHPFNEPCACSRQHVYAIIELGFCGGADALTAPKQSPTDPRQDMLGKTAIVASLSVGRACAERRKQDTARVELKLTSREEGSPSEKRVEPESVVSRD